MFGRRENQSFARRARDGSRAATSAWAYRVVFGWLGLLLVITALLKGHQLSTSPLPPTESLSPTVLGVVVQCELLVGTLLLFDIASRALWRLSLILFGIFSIVSLQKAVLGYDSCGCFGNITVSPWWTLAIDVSALGALLIWRPPLGALPSLGNHSRWVVAVSLYAAVALPIGIAMAEFEAKRLSTGMQLLEGGETVLLEPKDWIDGKLPLIPYIDDGEKLRTGKWTILLIHQDCRKCQEVVLTYERFAPPESRLGSSRLGFVELPPLGFQYHTTNPYFRTHLSEEYVWFVTTPVELQLENGIVTAVATDTDKFSASDQLVTR